MNESTPVNTPLSPRLKVTDGDSGRNAKVRLRITAGNRNGMFRINPVSGVMYVARPLDRERRSSYTFTVSALDQVQSPTKIFLFAFLKGNTN